MRGVIRLGAITTAALLVAACGSDPAGETVDEPPTLRPVVVEQALWDAASAGAVSTVTDAALRGDTAVIVGEERDGFRLAVVDAATGAPRWSIGERDPLPGGGGIVLFRPTIVDPALLVAGPPEDFLVFVPYYRGNTCAHATGWCPRESGRSSRAEQGVAALSGKDGSVRWSAPVITGEEDRDMRLKLLAASEDLLLVGSVGLDDSRSSLTTTAIRTSDGRPMWRQGGMEAHFISGETVIAHIPTERIDILSVGRGLSEGVVVALDATTGDRRWDLSERFATSDTWVVAGDLAVVHAEAAGTENTLVLEVATGREVARLGAYAATCASDAHSLIACAESPITGNRLITFRLDERRVRVSRDDLPESGIHAVWAGRIFLGYGFLAGRDTVVDRSGNVLPEPAPGRLVTISERYAVFSTGEDSDISVHRVRA